MLSWTHGGIVAVTHKQKESHREAEKAERRVESSSSAAWLSFVSQGHSERSNESTHAYFLLVPNPVRNENTFKKVKIWGHD